MESTVLNDNWLFGIARAHCAECERETYFLMRGGKDGSENFSVTHEEDG